MEVMRSRFHYNATYSTGSLSCIIQVNRIFTYLHLWVDCYWVAGLSYGRIGSLRTRTGEAIRYN